MKRAMTLLLLLTGCADEAPAPDPRVAALEQEVSRLSDALEAARQVRPDPRVADLERQVSNLSADLDAARGSAPPTTATWMSSDVAIDGPICWILREQPDGHLHLALYTTRAGDLRLAQARMVTYDLMLIEAKPNRSPGPAESFRDLLDEIGGKGISAFKADPETGSAAATGDRGTLIFPTSGSLIRLRIGGISLQWAAEGLIIQEGGKRRLIERGTWTDRGLLKD